MGLFHCEIHSEELDKYIAIYVFIPDPPSFQSQQDSVPTSEYKVLYLLHGEGEDYTRWVRYTSLERIAAECNIAVVMPDAGRGICAPASDPNAGRLIMYEDIEGIGNYSAYIGKELPGIVNRYFGLSDKRENRFIAGVGQGGLGAAKIAFRYPETFCAAVSLASTEDISLHADYRKKMEELSCKVDFRYEEWDGVRNEEVSLRRMLDRLGFGN